MRNHFVLASGDVDKTNADSNNNIFTAKDSKLYVSVVNLSARDSKGFER